MAELMTNKAWNEIIKPYTMSYYVLKVGTRFISGFGTTPFQALAKTFISEAAATSWATRNAVKLNWTIEKLEA